MGKGGAIDTWRKHPGSWLSALPGYLLRPHCRTQEAQMGRQREEAQEPPCRVLERCRCAGEQRPQALPCACSVLTAWTQPRLHASCSVHICPLLRTSKALGD